MLLDVNLALWMIDLIKELIKSNQLEGVQIVKTGELFWPKSARSSPIRIRSSYTRTYCWLDVEPNGSHTKGIDQGFNFD